MRKAIVFETPREGYGIDQLGERWSNPMTVGELRCLLEDFDDDVLFVMSHDRGYTYGSIHQEDISFAMETDEENGNWEIVDEDDFFSCETSEDYFKRHEEE